MREFDNSNIEIGDILILKVAYDVSDLSYRKGDKFKITSLLKTSKNGNSIGLHKDRIVYLVLTSLSDDKTIHFSPNMDYFATVEEYLCINRSDRLKKIGI